MRRQLPAYSPLSPTALMAASVAAAKDPVAAREELRRYLGERYSAPQVHLVGSGTQALRLALELVRPVRRSERRPLVALPAYSCYDVISAAVGAEARVVFYDIDPANLAPDPHSLTAALAAGADALVAGNLFGFPVDWSALRSQCSNSGALLIEDAAQALGSSWNGSEGGCFGDLTVLSFGRGKGWTGGGGGALLVRTALPPEAEARLLATAAAVPGRVSGPRAALLASVQWALGRPSLFGLATALPWTGLGETVYREPASVTAMPSFCAAAVRRHASMAQRTVEQRRARAAAWGALLGQLDPNRLPRQLQPCEPLAGGEAGWLRFPVMARDAAVADAFARTTEAAGAARAYPLALPDISAARVLCGDSQPACSGARHLAATLVTLPTHPWVSERDRQRVSRAIAG